MTLFVYEGCWLFIISGESIEQHAAYIHYIPRDRQKRFDGVQIVSIAFNSPR